MPDQPELRQRLEQVLIEHTFVQGDDKQPGGCTGATCTWHGWFLGDWRRHISDVLLSLPGIAIVQLPEPTEDTDVGYVFSEGSVAGTVLAADYAVCHQGWEYTAEQARDVGAQWLGAAALLAAAGAAEEQTNA